MFVDFIIKKFKDNLNSDAVIFENKIYNYEYLLERFYYWQNILSDKLNIGNVVAVQADYNPDSITLMLALIENGNIFVPFSYSCKDIEKKIGIAEAEFFIKFDEMNYSIEKTGIQATHSLITTLKDLEHPGIIIFSSGSTGEPKAAIHDFTKLLNKFKVERYTLRTINFLLFDHWGGINTLLYIFSNAGVVGVAIERTPEDVCEFIEKYRIELLPTTPTFINLILMSHAYEKYDLSSLKIVSYGTESMPESTLKLFHKLYPKIKLKQTYGLTELGVMRTQTKNSESLWVKVGGEDYETKILDSTLFIKAKSAILGYLNADCPYDDEGWYNTGDIVEQDGDWIKFLGRDSDIINVGGQKVYPAEVESVILEIDNIADVSVFAKENLIMGEVVAARINLVEEEMLSELKKRVRKYCKEKLESYKIPVHIEVTKEKQVSDRFKKAR